MRGGGLLPADMAGRPARLLLLLRRHRRRRRRREQGEEAPLPLPRQLRRQESRMLVVVLHHLLLHWVVVIHGAVEAQPGRKGKIFVAVYGAALIGRHSLRAFK